jgi:hypothetical protein
MRDQNGMDLGPAGYGEVMADCMPRKYLAFPSFLTDYAPDVKIILIENID